MLGVFFFAPVLYVYDKRMPEKLSWLGEPLTDLVSRRALAVSYG